jgi:hypothetical protein
MQAATIWFYMIWFYFFTTFAVCANSVLVVEILKYKPFCCITARKYHNSQNKYPVSLCDYVRVSRGRILERKSLKSFPLRFFSLLLTVTSTNGFYFPPPPFSKSGLKLVLCKQYIRKPQVWELSRLCPETSRKLYIHKFGFWIHADEKVRTLKEDFLKYE